MTSIAPASSAPLKVLVVDDSAIVRKMIGDALRAEPGVEVVGGAGDPFVARDMILQLRPDVLTLDIEMPRMDGLTFLRKLMVHHPLPVIVVSSLTRSGSEASVDALRAGAIDVIAKPDGPASVGKVTERLRERIRALKVSRPRLQMASATPAVATPVRTPLPGTLGSSGLLLIGASTGGPQAIEAVLTRLPADVPPTLVVQHMPATFTAAFAARLDQSCPMRVFEARGG